PSHLRHRCGSIDPAIVLFDEVDEALDGLVFGDVELHRFPAYVEVDLAGGSADVAEVGVGHFTGTVDDAAHHRDAHALEMAGGLADLLGGRLQVEESTTAARTGHVVGFENAGSRRLEDIVAEPERLSGRLLALDENAVADAVAEQRADVPARGEEGLEEVPTLFGGGKEGVLQQDGVFGVGLCREEPEGGNDREVESV